MTTNGDNEMADVKQSIKYAEDLTKLYNSEKQKRKEIEAANEKINAIVDSINDGMAATDVDFTIVQVNNALCRMLGQNKENMLGKNFLTFFENQGVKDKLDGLRMAGNDNCKHEFEADLPNNRAVKIDVTSIQNENGFVFVLHDITAAKRAENLKTEFLSIMSHEIRTPLNAIIGFTDLLQEEIKDKLDEDCIEYCNTIKRNGDRITDTINELLNFVALKHKGLDSIDEEVDISNIICESIERISDKNREKCINIVSEHSIEEAIIRGNKTMLSELFYHIIENSVIYGNKDGNVKVKLLIDDNTNYLITVEDDGIGISTADLERVFDSFFQVEEYSARSAEGLGLGLTLAKRIAELHGGNIEIKSEPGKGTTCYVSLPRNRSRKD